MFVSVGGEDGEIVEETGLITDDFELGIKCG